MKFVNAKFCALIALLAVFLSFSSCSKKSDPAPGIVSFAQTNSTYGEDQGTVNVTIKLNAKQSSDVTVAFTYAGSSDTYYDGDYYIGSTSPVTIPAGQTEASIQVIIINDTQIDADDDLTLTLTTVTGHAKLSTTATQLAHDLTISNDDSTPANGLQIDLTWQTTANADVDAVDLDLLLDNNVMVDGSGNPTSGDNVQTSTYSSGFETVILNTNDPDGVYYVIVPYAGGSGAVTLTLTFNGFGINGETLTGGFTAAQNTGDFINWAGPYTKNGNTFGSRTMSKGNFKMGTVIRIKPSDFKLKK